MTRKPAAALLAASVLTGGLLFGVSQQVPAYTSEECRPGSGGLISYPYCRNPHPGWWASQQQKKVFLPMVYGIRKR